MTKYYMLYKVLEGKHESRHWKIIRALSREEAIEKFEAAFTSPNTILYKILTE